MYERVILDYLPPVLRDVREYKALAEAEQPVVATLWDDINDVFNDQFLGDTTQNGAERWEGALGIMPKGTATLEDRVFVIKSRLNESAPYTYPLLVSLLTTLCGESGHSIIRDVAARTITVRIDLIVRNQFDAAKELLSRLVPANMVVDVSLLYNNHNMLAEYTHAELAARTHKQLTEDIL